MQAVISRVHRIVTTHTSGDAADGGDRSAGASPLHLQQQQQQQSAAAAALSSLGTAPPMPLSITIPPQPHAAEAASSQPLLPSARRSPTTAATQQPPPVASPTSSVSTTIKQEIQLAVEQLQYATLLSERKSAVQALHTLARNYVSSPHTQRSSSPSSHEQHESRSSPAHCALGDTSVPVILNALVSDPRDTELMEAMLELLQALVAGSPTTAAALIEPMRSSANSSISSSAYAFAHADRAPTSGVQIGLELLTDPSPWIRGPTITLLKQLQEASQRAFAARVLECHEGLRRLLDVVVTDKREHIRDAALQVLVKLTERETTVQQFLAFEDGFTHLFGIMAAEGLADGASSVLSDCLQIVNNMVRDNVLTQTLLRETPFLETHVPQLLRLPRLQSSSSDTDTYDTHPDTYDVITSSKSYQKRRALKLALQLVRFLVAGLYEGVPDAKLDDAARRGRARKAAELEHIQSFIGRQRSLMGAIGELACCGREELTDIQLQALDLLELLGCADGTTQLMLVHLRARPSRRSVLAEFMRLDCADDESPVSAAATSLLDALFRNNETATMAIFQQLNAPPMDDDDEEEDDDIADTQLDGVNGSTQAAAVPAGRVLLDALIVNAEAITSGSTPSESVRRTATIVMWKAAHRLTSLLASSAYCKDLALRIPSEYDRADVQAVTGGRFFTRCLRALGPSSLNQLGTSSSNDTSQFHVRVALLTLLVQWCAQCSSAVHEVVASVANVSLLIELFGRERDDETTTRSHRVAAERVHIRGLVALLLGCCLEFLVDDPQKQHEHEHEQVSVPTSVPNGSATAMTRAQLLEIVSKRIGLARFTNALVQFQQAPLVVACARASQRQSARNLLPPSSIRSRDDDVDSCDTDGDTNYLFALYDKAFIGMYRELADRVQRRMIAMYTSADDDVNAIGGPTNHAMSAYQDLIRIQDKQIQDLNEQLRTLRTATEQQQQQQGGGAGHVSTALIPPVGTDTGTCIDSSAVREAVETATREADAAFATRLETLERAHATERLRLEDTIRTLEAAAVDRESRYSGLSTAFEQLEAEYHLRCSKSSSNGIDPIVTTPATTTRSNTNNIDIQQQQLDAMAEQCRTLELALREEQQLRVDSERHASLDRHELEMHRMALQHAVETERIALAQRDEQLRHAAESIDALEAAQNVLKRENAALRDQLAVLEVAAATNNGSDTKMTATSITGISNDNDSIDSAETQPTQYSHHQQQQQAAGESLSTELDALRQQLATTHAELEVARASQRELEQLRTDETTQAAAAHTTHTHEVTQLQERIASQQDELEELRARIASNEQLRLDTEAQADAMRSSEQLRLDDIVTRLCDCARAAAGSSSDNNDQLQLRDIDTADPLARLEAAAAYVVDTLRELVQQHVAAQATRSSSSVVVPDTVTSADNSSSSSSVSDDALVLLASLEIHCMTLRDALRAAQGDAAVVSAAAIAHQRGAAVQL